MHISLYAEKEDMGGYIRLYDKWAIWVDAIRLYSQNRDTDGQLCVYMQNWKILGGLLFVSMPFGVIYVDAVRQIKS
jgi:hypothetical protein